MINTFAPNAASHPSEKKVPDLPLKSSIIIVGAGAFGGWTALSLLRLGYHVTLIDAWGPGNSRSSSGDETRVIRSTYGANELYFDLNTRALELWKENQNRWGKKLFFNTGVIWFCYQEKNPIVDDSIPFARRHKMEYHYLTLTEINKRYPQIYTGDLHHGWFDPYGGYLKARESCHAVQQAFLEEGGEFLLSSVTTPVIQSGELKEIVLADGNKLTADVYIFACGSWLGQLFPDVLNNIITCTKQEAYYLGVPREVAGAFEAMPVWIDLDGLDFYYGIPGNAHRGFKVGVDFRGEPFDPTHGDRLFNPKVMSKARAFMGHRFPALKKAPIAESRVCPYENSPDGNFLFDHHPQAKNVWFLGGGSGHGFKHGPALGERIAQAFFKGDYVPSTWRIKR